MNVRAHPGWQVSPNSLNTLGKSRAYSKLPLFILKFFSCQIFVVSFHVQKWQRRFFVLYEHGLLRYALDDLVSQSSLFSSRVFVASCGRQDVVCHFSGFCRMRSLATFRPKTSLISPRIFPPLFHPPRVTSCQCVRRPPWHRGVARERRRGRRESRARRCHFAQILFLWLPEVTEACLDARLLRGASAQQPFPADPRSASPLSLLLSPSLRALRSS